MLVGQLPDASGLFFAVDTDGCAPAVISGTGLHDTLCGARKRCDMERLERTAAQAPERAWDDACLAAYGSAAAPCRALAETRAAQEAMERLLCGLWWSGRLRASAPPKTAVAAATAALNDWNFALPDLPDLIALNTTGFPPVIVALLVGSDGRGLCLGAAARDSWAAAARAAIREALQMKLGLDVIRYRFAHGRAPAPREMAILHRAGGLTWSDMQALLPGHPKTRGQPEIAVTRQLWSRRTRGVWLAQCQLRMTTDPGAPVTGPWSRFALWS